MAIPLMSGLQRRCFITGFHNRRPSHCSTIVIRTLHASNSLSGLLVAEARESRSFSLVPSGEPSKTLLQLSDQHPISAKFVTDR